MTAPGIRLRLTLWYGLAAALVLLGCGIAVDYMVGRELTERIDEQLLGEFGDLGERLEAGESISGLAFGREMHEHHPYLLRVTGAGGKVLVQNEGLDLRPDLIPADRPPASGPVLRTIDLPEVGPQRILTATLKRGGRGDVVQLVMSLKEVLRGRQEVRAVLWTVLPAGLLASAFGGWWLAGRALSPIRTMTDTANRISADRLEERVPVANPTDELGQLAGTLNSMLERLRRAFDSERRFTADASHELMTPLAVVRTEIDVALRSKRSEDEYRDVLASLREEVVRMTRLADNLLLLSREDARGTFQTIGTAELGALAAEASDSLRLSAADAGVRVHVHEMPALAVAADPDQIRPALTNLIDNAIKYTTAGGTVTIRGYIEGKTAVVEVADTGIGIPADELQHIFDRFYRVDKSRSRKLGGAGLGLSIAKVLAERHGGRIEVESEPGRGSTFRLILPLRGPSQAQASAAPPPLQPARHSS